MTDAQAQFRVETGSVDDPKVINLGPKQVSENYRMGLRKVIVRQPIAGFGVKSLSCAHCGLKDDYKTEETACHRCRAKLDNARRTARDLSSGKVGNELLANKTMWQCEGCLKKYEEPQLCCSGQFLLENKKEPQHGYMCMGCNTIRSKKVKCCTGFLMVEGDFYTKPTQEALDKIQNRHFEQIEGIYQ